jgi:hypothetical protein
MTSQPPPDPYGQPQQPDPYGQGSSAPGQQPYQQPGYPAPGYPPQPPTGGGGGGTNVMAILALVFAFVFWPAGIVCGHIAKKQIAERGEEGSGLATAGLILSYVFGGLTVLACCGLIALVVAEGNN